MTEKRFVYDEIEDCIYDKVDLKTYWGVDDTLANKLNELHEENRTLLHIIDWCLTHHREVGHIVFDSRDEFFIWLNEKGVLE